MSRLLGLYETQLDIARSVQDAFRGCGHIFYTGGETSIFSTLRNQVLRAVRSLRKLRHAHRAASLRRQPRSRTLRAEMPDRAQKLNRESHQCCRYHVLMRVSESCFFLATEIGR